MGSEQLSEPALAAGTLHGMAHPPRGGDPEPRTNGVGFVSRQRENDQVPSAGSNPFFVDSLKFRTAPQPRAPRQAESPLTRRGACGLCAGEHSRSSARPSNAYERGNRASSSGSCYSVETSFSWFFPNLPKPRARHDIAPTSLCQDEAVPTPPICVSVGG